MQSKENYIVEIGILVLAFETGFILFKLKLSKLLAGEAKMCIRENL